jgi:hypothetical protein
MVSFFITQKLSRFSVRDLNSHQGTGGRHRCSPPRISHWTRFVFRF